jgi:imidazole glycerol-phosphate synthase subunit HisF
VTQDVVGELYLNSIDPDGTGHGYDLQLLNLLPASMPKPVILAGGVGNATHLAAGLTDPRVDTIATADLFNFVGYDLKLARLSFISGVVELPLWNIQLLEKHFGFEQVGEVELD